MPHMANLPWINMYLMALLCLIIFCMFISFKSSSLNVNMKDSHKSLTNFTWKW